MIAGITEIVDVLLDRKIPFCVYRIPGKSDIGWAFPPEILSQPVKKFFCFAPFTKNSSSSEIIMGIQEVGFVTKAFVSSLKSYVCCNNHNISLPHNTTFKEYSEQFGRIKQYIQENYISKAILSRVIIQKKSGGFDIVQAFDSLCNDYPDTFSYLISHPSCGVWLGATPELLIESADDIVKIMAIAGTQPRKSDKNYHWRKKEMDEHSVVGKHIEEVFINKACILNIKKGPYTIETGRVAHLRTDYTYRFNDTVHVKDLVAAIHPTPAIGGHPMQKSIDIICNVEKYDRTYYCGYLGETDFKSFAQLYVNLRCMQVGETAIAVYVGGGITADSDVQEEWEETEIKSKTMLDVLIKNEVV